jgi:hypothetical protein
MAWTDGLRHCLSLLDRGRGQTPIAWWPTFQTQAPPPSSPALLDRVGGRTAKRRVARASEQGPPLSHLPPRQGRGRDSQETGGSRLGRTALPRRLSLLDRVGGRTINRRVARASDAGASPVVSPSSRGAAARRVKHGGLRLGRLRLRHRLGFFFLGGPVSMGVGRHPRDRRLPPRTQGPLPSSRPPHLA